MCVMKMIQKDKGVNLVERNEIIIKSLLGHFIGKLITSFKSTQGLFLYYFHIDNYTST